ncbi:hypothetical protein [Deinococcus soli (ex Cha et al. 2016)]|uniref:Uncharacterized protein n=2 Tax=Deinococcus soli (ex Cha et al. 2016) TaxID=1309411 RepID=A0AAE4BLD7_9DEIO|nr:hypothetical protein [Deinococcus soli (ex Cha et al. 2016)]MDR6218853.1 hypothetical protein [Deinococcus soli (ex Cha et al. 2016)]MDR6328650.1 hypothetical protein [Deinococcus soli (ex Cha et al. 2016)]MDR6751863.1 hypothetical protein [Deinococcus soli (ex Cha et al. 2016)]
MQDKTLTAQARRAATLLRPLGVNFTHTQALKFLAQTLGYGTYQELKVAQPAPLRAPLSPDALRAAANADGQVTQVVRYALDALTRNTPRETEEDLSYAISGGPHLTDLAFELAGHDGDDLLLRVTAQAGAALAQLDIPPVPGVVSDEYGHRHVHVDAARALSRLDDDTLTQILGRSATDPGSTDLYQIATDTAAWNAELSAFLDDLNPHVGVQFTLDLAALLTFALRTRPHLREQLTAHAQDLHEDGHLDGRTLAGNGLLPRLPDVTACVRSDNGAFEETVTINEFLATCTPEDLTEIVFEDGFGPGYSTDQIVHYYEDTNERLAAMQEMNRALRDQGVDAHGFSVTVDPEELGAWVAQRQQHDDQWTSLHARIVQKFPGLLG